MEQSPSSAPCQHFSEANIPSSPDSNTFNGLLPLNCCLQTVLSSLKKKKKKKSRRDNFVYLVTVLVTGLGTFYILATGTAAELCQVLRRLPKSHQAHTASHLLPISQLTDNLAKSPLLSKRQAVKQFYKAKNKARILAVSSP